MKKIAKKPVSRTKYSRKYYLSNKKRILEYSKTYYQEHREQILEARKKSREEKFGAVYASQEKNLAENEAPVVKTRSSHNYEYHHNYYLRNKEKFRQYRENMKRQPKSEEELVAIKEHRKKYQKAYRDSHKDTAEAYRKEYYNQTKGLNEIAKKTCPAFWFLLSVREKNLNEYLKCYRPGQNIVRIGRKLCEAAKTGDSSKCPFCNSENTNNANCPMPHVFEFDGAKEKLLHFGNKIKKYSK